MKKKVIYKERGQALIMIAFAVVGLVAFTALAIDGGRVFSDRRHSQNTSDTSALAAALERVRRPTEDWKSVARSRATDNGYTSNGVTQVDVYLCSELASPNPPVVVNGYTLTCKGLPDGADPSEYVYVHIKSVVDLMFARIIGWRTITNHTDAVARAKVPVRTSWANGNGIWATKPDCKSPGDGDPFKLGGSANNKVLGSGILVNSSCPNYAFVQSGGPKLYTDKGVCVHGKADYVPGDVTSGTGSAMTQDCPAIDANTYEMPPAPDCSNPGKLIDAGGGEYVASPGYYDKTGNKQFPDVGGGATVRLLKGVYCLYNGVGVNANVTFTTDSNKNGSFDPATEGVLFYLPGLDASTDTVSFNGGATIDLHAIHETTLSWFDESWLNLLIYVNPDYAPDIDLSGSAGSTYTGTILAPSANVHLLGNNGTDAGTVTLDSQIIANTVELSGNTNFTLIYNQENNATTLENPNISQTE